MSSVSKNPVQLFVSHISEEQKVAALLKEIMEEDFLSLEFFTSSDIGSIHAGDEWLPAVTRAISKAVVVIVLCSKASVQRPWVQFELGAAWMKGVHIIPVCHSGMKVGELQMPLSRLQGVEFGTALGLERLYSGVAHSLNMREAPQLKDLPGRLARIAKVEEGFRRSQLQQFERHIDIVIPAPGRLENETIPDSAIIESNDVSLQLFGFIGGERTWQDIARAARKKADTRWLGQLQRCIYLASNDELFQPVQAIYHTERGSYQPQLAKREVLPTGACRFHVHFVETVVAPLSEVQNDFGLLATLLRLGLRFRYEVIERFQRLARAGTKQPTEEQLQQLRGAIEVIENDALSRGAENIDRDAIAALFERVEDQDAMTEIQDMWDEARALLFRSEPSLTAQEMSDAIACMRGINYRFMDLGTQRFHEMVHARWSTSVGETPPLAPATRATASRDRRTASLPPGAGCPVG